MEALSAVEIAGKRADEVDRANDTFEAFRGAARGLARGAVVVVISEDWERGDPALHGEQMARLQRLAHSLFRMNLHRGEAGYEPLQQGVVGALLHVHHLLASHSLRRSPHCWR